MNLKKYNKIQFLENGQCQEAQIIRVENGVVHVFFFINDIKVFKTLKENECLNLPWKFIYTPTFSFKFAILKLFMVLILSEMFIQYQTVIKTYNAGYP